MVLAGLVYYVLQKFSFDVIFFSIAINGLQTIGMHHVHGFTAAHYARTASAAHE
jgi:hypothetical protein